MIKKRNLHLKPQSKCGQIFSVYLSTATLCTISYLESECWHLYDPANEVFLVSIVKIYLFLQSLAKFNVSTPRKSGNNSSPADRMVLAPLPNVYSEIVLAQQSILHSSHTFWSTKTRLVCICLTYSLLCVVVIIVTIHFVWCMFFKFKEDSYFFFKGSGCKIKC